MKLPGSVAIIGAGASGLFMAAQLQKLADEQGRSIRICLFEKEPRVGGKCRTYEDEQNPGLCSEFGAGAVAGNYGLVMDAMKKHDVAFEYMLPLAEDGIDVSTLFANFSFIDKAQALKDLACELLQFDAMYLQYKRSKDNKLPLPEHFEIPFSEFCLMKGWRYVELLLKRLVPGFGYGDLTHCPTYSVLEYMGRTTLPSYILNGKLLMRPPLLAIHGGYQTLLERMAVPHEVKCSVHIDSIKREPGLVTIAYTQGETEQVEEFEALVLANSPLNWPSLNMELTETERKCVDNLTYYRYPVAVVKIKGLPAKQYFFPEALEEAGFGHVALITSRDDRQDPEDGRLCTIYVNQPAGPNQFDFEQQAERIRNDLKAIDGVTEVEFIETKYWEDYFPSLPWGLRLQLDSQQAASATNTIYLGAHTLGTFEDVISNANNACRVAETLYGQAYTPVENFSLSREAARACFFYGKAYAPMNDSGEEVKEQRGCTIL